MRGHIVRAVQAAIFLQCLVASQALAWGFPGHRVVGEIAYQRLNPKAKKEVDRLLKIANEPTLAEAATWADRVARDAPEYAFSKKLHYLNFSKTIAPAYDNIAPACIVNSEDRGDPQDKYNGCVLFAIEGYASVLRSRGADDLARWEALLFVAHFDRVRAARDLHRL